MNYFLVSMRYNRKNLEDYGLVYKDGKYIRPEDNTEWCERMFDFGWGDELGFYKIPLGSFDELMTLVLNGVDAEDSYAAAAIILEDFPLELKKYLLEYMNQKVSFRDSFKRKKLSKKLTHFFYLERGNNLTAKEGMSTEQINNEYKDWRNIATYFDKFAFKLYR